MAATADIASLLASRPQAKPKLDPVSRELAYRAYLLPLGRTNDGSLTIARPGIVDDAINAFKLPHDVMTGEVPINGPDGHTSDTAVKRAFDLAGMITLGAGAMPAESNSLRAGIKAYHGSPHDFNEFDLSKIGTGEGAQAYGHGLYFAEKPDVARAYRDNLSNPSWQGSQVQTEVRDALKAHPTDQAAIQSLHNKMMDARNSGNTWEARVFQDAVNNFNEIKKQVPRGHMYEVNINADPNSFLDWDKPLYQQPEVAQKLGISADDIAQYKNISSQYDDALLRSLSGDTSAEAEASTLLKQMNALEQKGIAKYGNEVAKGNSVFDRPQDANASARMLDAGIPGIKYLDAGSRSATDGTRNYVVFDPKIIDIVKKYGIVGALGLGAITKEQAQQMQAQGM